MTDINTPASEEFNLDSTGLMQIMLMLANKSGRLAGEDESVFGSKLTDVQISEIYENNKLIQKIVNKYPQEFKTLGYEIKNQNGKLIEKDDDNLLNAFKDALIASRLYGRCFLKLEFDDFNDDRALRRGSKLLGHSIHYDLYQIGDYFNIESEPIHFSRIIEFIGEQTYRKYVKKNDPNYCQSVIQSLYISFRNYIDNNNSAKYLLNNLAYLTIGIENLGNMQISDEGKKIVFDRLTTLNINRSIGRLLAYDKSKEAIGFINQSIAGVNDLIEQTKTILASETDYPVSEIFETGQSQALGSGIQNQLVARYLWARRVRNWTINNVVPYLKTYFDRTRDMTNLAIWIPFVVDLTDEEKADIEKKAADRSKVLIDSGIVTPDEARSNYRGDMFTLDIILDEKSYEADKAALSASEELKQERELKDQQNTPASNTDADVIPDDLYWDELANISSVDLEILSRNTIKGSFFLIDDFELNDFDDTKPVFEILTRSGSIFAVNFDTEEQARTTYINTFDPFVQVYLGISEVKRINENEDCNNDRGCAPGNIIRGAKGRFAGYRGGGSGGASSAVEAPASINSKTNIAQ